MGQKINPISLRLGVLKDNWVFKYSGKNFEENSFYALKSLQTDIFFNQLFNNNLINLKKFKSVYTEQKTSTYFSILENYNNSKFFHDNLHKYFFVRKKKKLKTSQKLLLIFFFIYEFKKFLLLLKKNFLNKNTKIFFLLLFDIYNVLNSNAEKNYKKFDYYKNIFYLKKFFFIIFLKKKWFNFLKYSVNLIENCKHVLFKNYLHVVDSFINKISYNLNYNIKNKSEKILFFFSVLNEKNFFFKNFLNFKQVVFEMRRFKKKQYFEEIFILIFYCLRFKNTAVILSNYISMKLPLIQDHRKFFTLIQDILKIFFKHKIFKTSGVKILINGRTITKYNKSTRTKLHLISIGLISPQSINTNVDYFCSTSFNLTGTIGVKVWIL